MGKDLNEKDQGVLMTALGEKKGFLRKRVGQGLHLKNTPLLEFFYDDTFDKNNRLLNLLESL